MRVRSSGTNRIVDVTCDSTSAQLAADFCNLLTQEFIDQNMEMRWQSTEYTGQWLTKQLQDLKMKLEQSEEELQAYARETSLVVTGEDGVGHETKLADLQKELSAAQTDLFSKQSQYEVAAASPAGALPAVIDDVSLKETQATLSELQAKLAQLQVTFTPNNAEVRRTQAQIEVIEASLERARANVSEAHRQRLRGGGTPGSAVVGGLRRADAPGHRPGRGTGALPVAEAGGRFEPNALRQPPPEAQGGEHRLGAAGQQHAGGGRRRHADDPIQAQREANGECWGPVRV